MGTGADSSGFMSASRLIWNVCVSSNAEDPGPDREEDGQAEKASAELKDQMNQLKARYRVERRLLETRSFAPRKGERSDQQGLATRPPPVR